MRFLGSNVTEIIIIRWFIRRCNMSIKSLQNALAAGAQTSYLDLRGPLRLLMLIEVPVCFNLVLPIYPSYSPWKSLKSPWIWFWHMGKNPAYHSIHVCVWACAGGFLTDAGSLFDAEKVLLLCSYMCQCGRHSMSQLLRVLDCCIRYVGVQTKDG